MLPSAKTMIPAPLSLIVALSLGTASCGVEFEPRTTLSGYRMVGIEANPPETTPEGIVELRAHDFYDGGEPLRYSWSVCPRGLGAAHDYACAVPQLEASLGSDPAATLDLGPNGLDLRRLLAEAGPSFAGDGSLQTLERGVDVWVRLTSGPDCSECKAITTVKRIVVREGELSPNQNPTIEQFEVIGPSVAEASVKLRVTVSTPEVFFDVNTGKEETEDYLYTWYTTGGETNPGSTSGDEQETELALPAEPGSIQVMVAVRDGRGGFALEERQIVVE